MPSNWPSLKPNGGGVPVGEIAKRIDSDFGGYARFAEHVPRRCRRAIWQRLGLAGARRQYPQR
jgi:hypothetical protein